MAQINSMNNEALILSRDLIATTLASLRMAGTTRKEGIVLWLGRRERAGEIRVVEVYVPDHEAESDYFWIPPESMQTLLRHLQETNTFIASQVHSHPKKAFHSDADDRWAIVRHLGALSLVVPHFAQDTTVDTFLQDIAAFRLTVQNKWDELTPLDRTAFLKI
jgi:hypothetical protein